MGSSQCVWIDVTQSSVDAALVRRGAVRASTRRWRPAPDGSDALDSGGLVRTVAGALADLGVRNPTVNVLWRDQGASSSVVESPAEGRYALTSAMLSLIETGEISPESPALRAVQLPAHAGCSGVPVLMARVSPEAYEAAEAAVTGAGASLGWVIAGDAAAVVLENAGAETPDDRPVMTLTPGESTSVVKITTGSEVRICRFVDVGIQPLRTMYTRALRAGGAEPEEALITATRLLLHESGIPGPESDLGAAVDAREVFRTMQPVLQRLAVELKQTARFTLTESERMNLLLRVEGPYASVRQLAEVIAEQIEADVMSQQSAYEPAPADWIAACLEAGVHRWRVCRPDESLGTGQGGELRALAAGGVLALAALAGVGFLADRAADQINRRNETFAALQASQRAPALGPREAALAEHAPAIAATLAAKLGVDADFGSVLVLLSEAAGPDLELESLRGQRVEAGSSLDITARGLGATSEDARQNMQSFIALLDESVLTDGIEVSSTQMNDRDGRFAADFRASIRLRERTEPWLKGGADR